MDHGKIMVLGTPQDLIREHFKYTAIEFATTPTIDQERLRALPLVADVQVENDKTTLYSSGVPQTIEALTRLAAACHDGLSGLTVRQATLEDVFLHLTGRRIRE
jgi:ABC-2 type transport system ATP-binding protein